MNTKLTLTLDDAVIKNAKQYAKSRNISLSRIVEGYFRRVAVETTGETIHMDMQLPPITKKLTGIARDKQDVLGRSYKEMLLEALEEKFLSQSQPESEK